MTFVNVATGNPVASPPIFAGAPMTALGVSALSIDIAAPVANTALINIGTVNAISIITVHTTAASRSNRVGADCVRAAVSISICALVDINT